MIWSRVRRGPVLTVGSDRFAGVVVARRCRFLGMFSSCFPRRRRRRRHSFVSAGSQESAVPLMRYGGDDEVEIDFPLVAPLRRPTLGADAVVGNVTFEHFDGEAGAAVEAKLGVPRLVAGVFEEGGLGGGGFGGPLARRGGGRGADGFRRARRVDGPRRGGGSAGASLNDEGTPGRTNERRRK